MIINANRDNLSCDHFLPILLLLFFLLEESGIKLRLLDFLKLSIGSTVTFQFLVIINRTLDGANYVFSDSPSKSGDLNRTHSKLSRIRTETHYQWICCYHDLYKLTIHASCFISIRKCFVST